MGVWRSGLLNTSCTHFGVEAKGQVHSQEHLHIAITYITLT